MSDTFDENYLKWFMLAADTIVLSRALAIGRGSRH